jgi:hypothetical protein
MPRRPGKQLGNKKPRALNKQDTSMKRWDKLMDIPMDDVDQCAYNVLCMRPHC